MNNKLIERAVECYVENLEEENETLKDFMRQIANAVSFKADNRDRTDEDILNDIMYVLRCYDDVFEKENENG